MITAILYGVFLVHVIVCTTADGSESRQLNNAGNQTKKLLSRENDTYQNNTNKECVLTVNETDLIFLQQLVRSKVVHVVEIDLQFLSNTSNSMIKEWRWNLTNNVGREILLVLAMEGIRVTWTLDVGRKTTKVRVVDEPPGCATTEKEPGVFIAEAILKQLSFVDEKEMCFDKFSNKSTQTRCCKIIGKDVLKYQYYVSVGGSEFVTILESMLSVYTYCIAFAVVFVFAFCGILLRWRKTNNTVREKRYYKLTECPVSISSILCMLFWDGDGRFKSFVRRCLLVLVVFLVFWELELFSHVSITVIFSLWAMFFLFSRWFDLKEFEDMYISKSARDLLKLLSSCFGHDIIDVYLSARINVLGAINLITLPFNVKRSKKSLVRFYHKFTAPSTMGSSLKDKILSFVKFCIFCLFYILFIFVLQVILVLLYLFSLLLLLVLSINGNCRRISCIAIVNVVYKFACFVSTFYLFLVFSVLTPYIVIPLVSGLILNFVYFFPYIVYISTLTFYSCMFWASVEQQYVVLMRLIFDQNINNNNNIDSSNNNDNNMNNDGSNASVGAAEVNQENMELLNLADTDHVGRDNEIESIDIDDRVVTEIVCVVSEELYDKIREHLLPYHGNLFRFVLKVLGISIYSYFTLTVVRILQASDISSTVQAITTFSVSAFPYIMNVVAAKKSEEEKEMWKIQLKHRVKPLVDKFTANNPKLSRTEWIIRHPLHLRGENAEEEMRGRESLHRAKPCVDKFTANICRTELLTRHAFYIGDTHVSESVA